DLNLPPDEFEDAALLLDTLRLALDRHRNGDVDGAVHPDAVEIGVEHRVGDRIELIFLDQHARIARPAEFQRDEGVGAGLGVKNLEQRARIHRDWRRLAAAALAAGAVYDRWDPPAAPRPPRFIFPE